MSWVMKLLIAPSGSPNSHPWTNPVPSNVPYLSNRTAPAPCTYYLGRCCVQPRPPQTKNIIPSPTTSFAIQPSTTIPSPPLVQSAHAPNAMARQRKAKDEPAEAIKLEQPDRSGPSDKTLLHLAEERKLFQQADERMRKKAQQPDLVLSPRVERTIETVLWSASLAMLHFAFDALVHQQYAMEPNMQKVWFRAGQAWLSTSFPPSSYPSCFAWLSRLEAARLTWTARPVFLFLFYVLHPHDSSYRLIPGVPNQYQRPIRQGIFFIMSIFAGCYLIHITNNRGYLANMKRAPPVACLWIWSVIEMDLLGAVASAAVAGTFFLWGGYSLVTRH